jgi:hypothetical protein
MKTTSTSICYRTFDARTTHNWRVYEALVTGNLQVFESVLHLRTFQTRAELRV